MDEFTPTTSDLCDAWGYFRHEGTDWGNPAYCKGFNRWLAEHDREVIRDFLNAEVEYVRRSEAFARLRRFDDHCGHCDDVACVGCECDPECDEVHDG